jgi:hypothetical protein
MSKRKLSQRKPRAPHLIHSFSTEHNFLRSSSRRRIDEPSRPFRPMPSEPAPSRRRSLRGLEFPSQQASEDARLARSLESSASGFRKQTRAEKRFDLFAIRSMAFRRRSGRRNDTSHRRSPARSSKPDRGDLRADCRVHFFQLNKRPVRKPATEFSTGRRDPNLVEIHCPQPNPGFPSSVPSDIP